MTSLSLTLQESAASQIELQKVKLNEVIHYISP